MWKIERVISKGDYDYALVKNHPNATKNGYVLHHRVLMENEINRLLTKDEVVHHINEQKKDNRIENLALMSVGDHCRHHKLTGRTMIELICPYCEETFERERRQTHLVKGGDRTFCSRSCSARFYRTVELLHI